MPAMASSENELSADAADSDEMEAWREVHSNLMQAVRIAHEAVSIEKAQRRYWLEEIAWNLSEDGNLTNASVWRQPTPFAMSSKDLIKTASSGAGTHTKGKKKGATSLESGDCRPTKKPRKKKGEGDVIKKPKKMKSASRATHHEEETPRTSPDAAEMSDRSYPPPDYPEHSHHQQQAHQHHQQQALQHHQQHWGHPPIDAAAQSLKIMVGAQVGCISALTAKLMLVCFPQLIVQIGRGGLWCGWLPSSFTASTSPHAVRLGSWPSTIASTTSTLCGSSGPAKLLIVARHCIR